MNADHFHCQFLQRSSTDGYGPRPIPVALDDQIVELIRIWSAADQDSRMAAVAGVDEQISRGLLAFGERMATLAFRLQTRDLIVLGATATGVDDWRYDYRENVVVLAPLWDAAERIGVRPAEVFEEAADLLPPQPASGLRAFAQRSDQGRSLHAMGYVVSSEADGFRYKLRSQTVPIE